jgi:hypothetical protein
VFTGLQRKPGEQRSEHDSMRQTSPSVLLLELQKQSKHANGARKQSTSAFKPTNWLRFVSE